MELVAEELMVPSTASPSPIPPPRDRPETSRQQYFRLKSLSTLTAPVDEVKLKTVAKTRTARLPQNLRPGVASPEGQRRFLTAGSSTRAWSREGGGTIEEEGKFPIPDNPTAWARYGFLEEDLLLRATGQSPKTGGGRRAASSGGEMGEEKTMGEEDARSRTLVRVRTDPGESWRQEQGTASAAEAGDDAERRQRHHPAASTAGEAGSSRQGEGGELSLDIGTSTPPTDIMTPSSEERRKNESQAAAGGAAGGGSATAAANNSNAGPATRRRGGGTLDSMAASMLASAEAAAAQAEGETKEQELLALQQHDARQAAMAAAAASATDEHQNSSGINRTNPQTIAEIERHKRNRAERLRAYGCQRTLYPRIVPGTGGGGSGNPTEMETEEAETEEWVNTLRVSAQLRGESLMAACSQSFAEHKAAKLDEEQQLEARAARTADVSGMEGPDGLLHCAVLKGEHALAARAAQFLVDKRGSNVNSRDEWGRTPLHTAAGKGMVAMARFFVRRGANVDALDQDERTPLFFACASGNTTMARYLTRIEVGARYDLRDKRGHLAGEYFWDSVEPEVRDEIIAILVAVGWPDPPPPPRNGNGAGGGSRGSVGLRSRGRLSGGGGGSGRRGSRNSSSAPPGNSGRRSSRGRGGESRDDGGSKRHSEGGEAGMKRLASDMRLLMKRR